MRKILYSPGFGGGWSTWHYGRENGIFSTQYQPIIDALERGECLMGENESDSQPFPSDEIIYAEWVSKFHPAVGQFVRDYKEKFGDEPFLGGLEDLVVGYVPDGAKVRVSEYDGSESIEVMSEDNYF